MQHAGLAQGLWRGRPRCAEQAAGVPFHRARLRPVPAVGGRLLKSGDEGRHDDLCAANQRHLLDARGLSLSSRDHHAMTVADFLARGLDAEQNLRVLTLLDIGRYVALRSREVQALPQSIDPSSRAGRRDHCILHLMAHCGLRPSEVVALRRDSINWDAGVLHVVQRKTRCDLFLPLAPQTLLILRDYLAQERDGLSTLHRDLLLRARCPSGPIERWAIDDIFKKRVRQARLGAIHAFARFLAARMPEALGTLQRVIALPYKRGEREVPIEYLDRAEIAAVLQSIDRSDALCRRDCALFALMR